MPDAVGLSDPSLAFNLNGVNDWSTSMPFIDVFHMARPWIGHLPGQWGGQDFNDLNDAGLLDENGWPTEIPSNLTSIGTVWAWGSSALGSNIADSRSGVYVMTYEGEGNINLQGVTILSNEDGRITFENTDGGDMILYITETDPDGNGDYIRDIKVVREEYVDLHEAGAIFNPEFIDMIADARQLRFMDWMETNNSDLSEWSDRTTVDSAFWSSPPVEIMVELANQIGSDPWFTLPHQATDEFIREFAIYVRDNLDPALVASVELSNEVWNGSFDQYHWARDMAIAEWGIDDGNSYYAYRATQMALIWEDVFGAEADTRLETVLGAQAVNTWLTENRLLDAPAWLEADPANYVRPGDVFDVLGVTTYFGGSTAGSTTLRNDLIAAIENPGIDAIAWLAERLMDPSYSSSIPSIANALAAQAALAEAAGMGLVAYEGGQHVHHYFGISSDSAQLEGFFTEFVRSEEMADLYQEIWDVWEDVGSGAFMQFVAIAAPGLYGSWGLWNGIGDITPRARLLTDLNEATDAWWEDRGGVHFQQGRTRLGTVEDETFRGTVQEDFLIGSGGRDTLIGRAGNDGLHGGRGADNIKAGAGDDTVVGGAGDDTLAGDNGDDQIEGQGGDDTARGGEGDDTIYGGGGADTILGGTGDDMLYGGDSNDDMRGHSGKDSMFGGDGNDSLTGGDGGDTLRGGNGNDTLSGEAGADDIRGHSGADILSGGSGKDIIRGGTGRDELTGGNGADTFVFALNDGHDTITDFNQGVDLIEFTAAQIDFADLTITNWQGHGVRVTYSEGNYINIEGLSLGDLDPGDFIFA